MIQVKKIDHVAIALPDVDQGLRLLLSTFGLHKGSRERITDSHHNQTDVCFLHAGDADSGNAVPGNAATPPAPVDDVAIELIAPAGNDSLSRFLDKRGSALHHICFEVDDLAGALATLKAAGVPLIDQQPRLGARGHQVAFIHPGATGGVLFELCQHNRPAPPGELPT